jgi:hypothetical protein
MAKMFDTNRGASGAIGPGRSADVYMNGFPPVTATVVPEV